MSVLFLKLNKITGNADDTFEEKLYNEWVAKWLYYDTTDIETNKNTEKTKWTAYNAVLDAS